MDAQETTHAGIWSNKKKQLEELGRSINNRWGKATVDILAWEPSLCLHWLRLTFWVPPAVCILLCDHIAWWARFESPWPMFAPSSLCSHAMHWLPNFSENLMAHLVHQPIIPSLHLERITQLDYLLFFPHANNLSQKLQLSYYWISVFSLQIFSNQMSNGFILFVGFFF